MLALCASLLIVAPAASAATIPVNTTDDVIANDGHCSLREAVISSNGDQPSGASAGECPGGGGPDTIAVPAGTFKLTIAGSDQVAAKGDLDVTAAVTVQGQGQGVTTLDAGRINRVLEVRAPNTAVRIDGVTITGGRPNDDDNGDGCRGGGVLSQGDLTISNSTISGNETGNGCSSRDGGGVASASGSLTIVDSVVSDNVVESGGPEQGSQCGTSCSGAGGETGGAGGGVWSAGGITVTRSTFSGNHAGGAARPGRQPAAMAWPMAERAEQARAAQVATAATAARSRQRAERSSSKTRPSPGTAPATAGPAAAGSAVSAAAARTTSTAAPGERGRADPAAREATAAPSTRRVR